MFDLISIGDTVVDTLIPLVDAEVLERNGRTFLALPYASKIEVGESVSLVGGNASNGAVGASRLGLKTAIYTNVGNKDEDEWDNRIIAKFKKEKVDTRYICETGNLVSGHNIVLSFKGERTILIYHQPWDFQLPDLDYSRWVYLTSMSPSYIKTNILNQVASYIERSGAKLAFQPGTFQIKAGIRTNNKILALSEIIILNMEEARVFLGFKAEENIPVKKLLTRLTDLGPKIAVITDGGEGSYAYDRENFYHMGIFPVKLLEMTGCGDAYSVGLLTGLFYREDLPKAMAWGALNGAAVCEQVGSQAGLLTYNQLKERLKNTKEPRAKLF